jgi:hypothetical protein
VIRVYEFLFSPPSRLLNDATRKPHANGSIGQPNITKLSGRLGFGLPSIGRKC